jgi:hypothetical protein
MNPEQQLTPPPGTPYDFIVNPGQPPKQKRNFGFDGNRGFFFKLGLGLIGVFILMMIMALLVNTFTTKKTNIADIVAIAQSEAEIVRISNLGKKAIAQNVRNAGMSTQLTIATQQQRMLTYLAENGRKVKDKELAMKRDINTDKLLEQALQTSTFDATFTQTMRTLLEEHGAVLKDAYNAADPDNKQERTLLSAHYDQIQVLLKQLP